MQMNALLGRLVECGGRLATLRNTTWPFGTLQELQEYYDKTDFEPF
jgi:hypothetical protein